ncbi:hypothetical protein F4819DRAFT_483808 [Hypoxylon fuscum]|nr:hypothetical protein F4819DRAFT_483808 [Hypoxylon fuscum]
MSDSGIQPYRLRDPLIPCTLPQLRREATLRQCAQLFQSEDELEWLEDWCTEYIIDSLVFQQVTHEVSLDHFNWRVDIYMWTYAHLSVTGEDIDFPFEKPPKVDEEGYISQIWEDARDARLPMSRLRETPELLPSIKKRLEQTRRKKVSEEIKKAEIPDMSRLSMGNNARPAATPKPQQPKAAQLTFQSSWTNAQPLSQSRWRNLSEPPKPQGNDVWGPFENADRELFPTSQQVQPLFQSRWSKPSEPPKPQLKAQPPSQSRWSKPSEPPKPEPKAQPPPSQSHGSKPDEKLVSQPQSMGEPGPFNRLNYLWSESDADKMWKQVLPDRKPVNDMSGSFMLRFPRGRSLNACLIARIGATQNVLKKRELRICWARKKTENMFRVHICPLSSSVDTKSLVFHCDIAEVWGWLTQWYEKMLDTDQDLNFADYLDDNAKKYLEQQRKETELSNQEADKLTKQFEDQTKAFENEKEADRKKVEAHVLSFLKEASSFEKRKEAVVKWTLAAGPGSVTQRRNVVSKVWVQHAKSLGDAQPAITGWIWAQNTGNQTPKEAQAEKIKAEKIQAENIQAEIQAEKIQPKSPKGEGSPKRSWAKEMEEEELIKDEGSAKIDWAEEMEEEERKKAKASSQA